MKKEQNKSEKILITFEFTIGLAANETEKKYGS